MTNLPSFFGISSRFGVGLCSFLKRIRTVVGCEEGKRYIAKKNVRAGYSSYCSVVSGNLLSIVCYAGGRRWVDGYPIVAVVEAPD